MDSVKALLFKINVAILNPLIALMFAVALLVFLFGVFEFIRDSDNSTSRAEGAQHMMWGIVGLFIMVSVYAILRVVVGTLGVPTPELLK